MDESGRTQTEKPRLKPYFIDRHMAETAQRSLPVLISSRLCWVCRQRFDDFQIINADPWDFVDRIVKHCSDEQDFLLPDTPMKEAIFRVLLGNYNEPMNAEQISAELSSKWPMTRITSPEVIQRLLDNSAYYCIAPASNEDILQAEVRQYRTSSQKHKPSRQRKRKDPRKPSRGTSRKADTPHRRDTPETAVRNSDPGDPFEKSDTIPTDSAPPELSDRFEKLLYWLSAYGEGARQAFTQACMTLEVANDDLSVRSAFRQMQLLGHIDVSDNGTKWSVSPAAFVRFSDEAEKGFLAGQRIPSMMNRAMNMKSASQPNYQGPPCVETSLSDWRDVVSKVTDAGSTSTKLSELLPKLAGWKDSLQHISKLNPAQFDMEIWELTTSLFESCSVPPYERNGRYHGRSGMYRLSRQRGRLGEYKPTLFFDEPEQRWLRGDWYGLRFLALDAAGTSTQAVHVSNTNELLMPEAQRWPMLYERALVLASGLLPGHADNRTWLKYRRITFELARTLCHKLNVQLRQEMIHA